MSAIGNQADLSSALSAPITPPPAPERAGRAVAAPPAEGSQQSFSALLQEASLRQGAPAQGPATTTELHFSRHALARLQKRNIGVDQALISRLSGAVSRAAAKGSRNAVVLAGGAAFVVSVPNRTVLTAVAPEQMREQIFTNIDSAVIA